VVDRIHLSSEDRDTLQSVLRKGLAERTDQWLPARIALARSLQLPEPPDEDRYRPLPSRQGGVEIHAPQLIGEGRGRGADLSEVMRAMLSAYHGLDVAEDDELFRDLLQRHVRRGLDQIRASWDVNRDFVDYLLAELYDNEDTLDDAPSAGNTAETLARVLGQLGVGATIVETQDGPRLTRFTLSLHTLEDLDRLRRNLTKVAFALGLDDNAITQTRAEGDQRVNLLVPRPAATWRTVSWSDVRSELSSGEAQKMRLPICLGTDAMGGPLLKDLAEAPHLLVAGTTGSGKSMTLHAILLSLIEAPNASSELLLIDPKAVEFTGYAKFRRLRTGSVITTAEAALVALEDLVEEMDARQERMRALDARDIDEANALGARMHRIVVVVDELADLLFARSDVETPLIRLAQKARSSGIHLVLATQRPEAATFSGLLRSNVPSRVALTVQKAAESRIILDEAGAEALQKRGDMLVRFSGEAAVRAHGSRIFPSDIQAAVGGKL
jgi:S-DNA-T family DNA segregation ATPase FtsK/SpoIIIE